MNYYKERKAKRRSHKKYNEFANSEKDDAEKHEEEDALDFLKQIKSKLKQKGLATDQKTNLKKMLKTQKEIVDILTHRADRRIKHKYNIVPRTLRNWWYKRKFSAKSPALTGKMNAHVKNLRKTQYKDATNMDLGLELYNHDTPSPSPTKTPASPKPASPTPAPPKPTKKAPSLSEDFLERYRKIVRSRPVLPKTESNNYENEDLL